MVFDAHSLQSEKPSGSLESNQLHEENETEKKNRETKFWIGEKLIKYAVNITEQFVLAIGVNK